MALRLLGRGASFLTANAWKDTVFVRERVVNVIPIPRFSPSSCITDGNSPASRVSTREILKVDWCRAVVLAREKGRGAINIAEAEWV